MSMVLATSMALWLTGLMVVTTNKVLETAAPALIAAPILPIPATLHPVVKVKSMSTPPRMVLPL
jgi:hypothetical protein